MGGTRVHQEYSIHVGSDAIYVEGGGEVLFIDKNNGQVKEHSSLVIPTQDEVIRALGIVGIIQLPAGLFLILIIKSKKVGSILDNVIYKIDETKLIQITNGPNLNQNQMQDHRTFRGMIESVLATPAFYYSYTFDLTHTQQRSVASFVLTRGSIPYIWNQRPNIKYKPKPVVSGVDDQVRVFKRHIDEQIVLYGRQVLVNLIDQKGGEKVLEANFADVVNRADYKMVKYVHFDFHKECSKMRWHRLQILMDRLKNDITEQSYYLATADGTVLQRQNGVFRVNCIDCLDRTNVVHSMLARIVLETQLAKLGIISPGDTIKQYSTFNDLYQNIWADNADACSTQYAGTGALKTDFTRTGKRTKLGLLMDGKNSAVRYYKNNFCDGYRQDSIDFFLGNYEWSAATRSPFQDSIQMKVRVVPIILIVSFSMAIIGVLLPPSESWLEQLMFIAFWLTLMGASFVYVLRHGPVYVNQPLLVHTLNERDR